MDLQIDNRSKIPSHVENTWDVMNSFEGSLENGIPKGGALEQFGLMVQN